MAKLVICVQGNDIAPAGPRIKSACVNSVAAYHLADGWLAAVLSSARQSSIVSVAGNAAKTPFDLIIFDCDGVLVDSEVISTHTLLDTLVAGGLEVDIEYVRKTYLGRSMSVVKADYLKLTGRDLEETFEADFLARLFAAYRGELAAMAGVKELIGSLSIPYCMATSSNIERARLSLELTGLLPLFEGRIFCASMVKRGKPAPDLFLHAAHELGADPAHCLVIEDSEPGLRAGLSAGMAVWRFVGGSHFGEGSETQLAGEIDVPVFHSMDTMAAKLRSA
jgi:HAD superfamily hydrolase (TIGR01509 family)